MTVTLIPDCEKTIGSYLREHPDVAALQAKVAGTIPSDTKSAWVRVTQLDAQAAEGHRGEHLIGYLVQFDCYAGTEAMSAHTGQGEASTLARTVRAALDQAIGQTLDGVVVTNARFTSMGRIPDTAFEPARERYVLDASIFMHA